MKKLVTITETTIFHDNTEPECDGLSIELVLENNAFEKLSIIDKKSSSGLGLITIKNRARAEKLAELLQSALASIPSAGGENEQDL